MNNTKNQISLNIFDIDYASATSFQQRVVDANAFYTLKAQDLEERYADYLNEHV